MEELKETRKMEDNKIQEIEAKIDKIYAWAKTVAKRLEELEKPTKSNLSSIAWSKEEKKYLRSKLTGVPKLRPIIIELEVEWGNIFPNKRSYDAIRKKWSNMNK